MKKGICLLLALLLVPTVALASTFGPSSTPTIQGMDVSVYQGLIDFDAVESDGIQMVYIRSSLGYDYVDPRFERNADHAKEVGIEFGFYHFCTASTEDEAVRQARFFADTISGFDYDLQPVLELSPARSLDKTEFTNVALAFLSELKRYTGQTGAVYTDASGARDRYDKRMAVYPLWVADYGVQEPESNDNWKSWSGFQYTSSGRVNGIDGRVDLDKFTKEMRIQTATPVPTATVTPTPTPTPTPCAAGGSYVVQSGDTLTKIAKRFGVTVQALKEMNCLTDDTIYTGQIIRY